MVYEGFFCFSYCFLSPGALHTLVLSAVVREGAVKVPLHLYDITCYRAASAIK